VKLNVTELKSGLGAFTSSGQEMDRAYSATSGACMGHWHMQQYRKTTNSKNNWRKYFI